MILIEGSWKSTINQNLHGRVMIKINAHSLSSRMKGTVKIMHQVDQQCIGNIIEFVAEIHYERNLDLIVDGQQNFIDRLFLRQDQLNNDIYYTMQLTSYNNGLWQGAYTTIYPN